MTSERFARLLIEGPEVKDLLLGLRQNRPVSQPGGGQRPGVDKKIAVFLNRLLLRIFSVPALMSYLNDVALFPDGQAKNGECKIQLVFQRLPDEVYPQMLRLISAPRDPKLVKFVDKGQARTGVEMAVKPEDFGGEDYDYAM
jgi:hypothetical protein